MTWYAGERWWIEPLCQWAALVPLAPLLWRRSTARLWWIGAAFAVSWVADAAVGFGVPAYFVSALYPVTQFGLLYGVLAPRKPATLLLLVTGVIAILAVIAGSTQLPEAALRITGSLAVVALVKDRADLKLIRPALLVYFGLGALCWLGYTVWPGLYPWLAYQAMRLAGLGVFTVAIWRER